MVDFGIKDLRKEIAEMNIEMNSVNKNIGAMAESVLILGKEISASMNSLTAELKETNSAIRDSLKVTSDTIKDMSDNFSKALADTMEKMTNMSINLGIKDSITKSLGIDGLIPDFLKK